MKHPKQLFTLLLIILSHGAYAQKNVILDKEDRVVEQLRLFMENDLYQKAYDLSQIHIRQTARGNAQDLDFETDYAVQYYHIISGLQVGAPEIMTKTDRFLSDQLIPEYYFERTCLYVGEYYFDRQEYNKAIPFLVQAGVVNLTEKEMYKKRFFLGYSYFLRKDFPEALVQFAAIKDQVNPYQYDANYYHGLITFGQGRYSAAYHSFKYIENYPKYRNVIPYYIAEIFYYNNELDKCISYAKKYAQQDSIQFKENYHALLAQAYFEKQVYDSTILEFNTAIQYGYEMQSNQNYTLGYAYYIEKEVDSAITYFKPLSDKKDSVGQNAMYLLADCYLQKNDLDAASKAFNYCKDLEFNQTIAENSHFNYIKAKFALGQYHETLRNIESFEKKYPYSKYETDLNYIMGNIFLTTNNFERGWEILAKDSNSTDPNTIILLQKIALQNGKSKLNNNKASEALKFLQYAVDHPELERVTQEAKLWLSETWSRLGDFDKCKKYALSYLRNISISNRNSNHTNIARYNLSLAYLQLHKPDSCIYIAKSNINNIEGEDPNHIFALSSARIGDAYFMKNNYSEAQLWYDKARKAQVDNYYILYQEAKISGLTKTGTEQTTYLKKVADDPNNPYRLKANLDLAEIYMDRLDYDNALKRFNICINENYQKSNALYKSGLSNEAKHKYDDALDNYILIIRDYPNSAESDLAYYQVRQIYISQNKLDELEKFLNSTGQQANSASMLDSSTYYVAENYFIKEDYKKAIQSFQRYQSKYPNGAFAANSCYYLGISYSKEGKTDEAIKTYKNCSSSPNNAYYDNINLALADIYLREKHDTFQAQKYFENIVDYSSNTLNQSDAITNLLNVYFAQSDAKDFRSTFAQLKALKNKTNTVNKNQYKIHEAQEAILDKEYSQAQNILDALKKAETSPYADEAFYLQGKSLLIQNKLKDAENTMLSSINLNFVSDYWNLRYYLLLAEIFVQQDDDFNAKATLNSLIEDSGNEEIVYRAQTILKEIKP